jgi:radical SAM superfamily enzyme YgiQ (UPF0313 family)
MVRDSNDVVIIDAYQADMSRQEFKDKIRNISPDLVGITVLMDEYAEAGHMCARLVKDVGSITTVIGGVYATTNSEQVMEDINIDYAVLGEGEYVLKNLVGYLMGINTLPDKGVCFRNMNGEVVNTGHSEFINDLDNVPFPAYDLIDFDKYANDAHRRSVDAPRAYPYARILTSRGCPFNCVFCQVGQISGKRFRERSADNVLDEIHVLKDRYGIKSIIFDDDNLLFDRARVIKLFQGMIDRELIMPWVMIATAAFELDEELLKLMKASGCEYIDVAFETGTERVLKQIIDKPLNFDYAKKMVKLAKDLGIFVTANFIVGFPTETWPEIRQTLKFAEEVDADYTKIFSPIPLRNTRLWQMCKENGYFKKGFDENNIKWSTGQIETEEFSADDLTILRAYEWDRINFTNPDKLAKTCKMMGITETEMDEARKNTLSKARQILMKERMYEGQAA